MINKLKRIIYENDHTSIINEIIDTVNALDEFLTGSSSGSAAASISSILERLTGVETELNNKINSADTYNKTELDTKLNNKANTNNVYSKDDIDTKIGSALVENGNYIKKEKNIINNLKELDSALYQQKFLELDNNGDIMPKE